MAPPGVYSRGFVHFAAMEFVLWARLQVSCPIAAGGEQVGRVQLAEAFTFTCSVCSEVHEGLPDLGHDAPVYYYEVPENERVGGCSLNSDLCIIDNKHFFIRAVLLVPIIEIGQEFGWGVWSSLSEANFKRYQELWVAEDFSEAGPYLGWLSNRLPFYTDTLTLKVRVHLQNDGQRPLLELEPTDHPLAVDQREGLPLARAVDMVQRLMHRDRGDF